MLNIFSLKKPTQVQPSTKAGKRATAAQLRLTKDLNELELPKTCKTDFPGKIPNHTDNICFQDEILKSSADPDDLLNFKLIIEPDEGFHRNGRFEFDFKIG